MNVKKTAGEKVLFRFSWFFFTCPVLPSGIYGTLFLSLMLLTTTAKTKHTIRGYLHLFADQQSAFHACARVNI